MNQKFAVVVALLLLSIPARAEVVHGTFEVFCPFDFSELACATDQCEADLFFAQVDPPGCTAVMTCNCGMCPPCNPPVVAIIDGKTLDEVEVAPADPAAYGCGDCIDGGDVVYVIRTREGLYAKFAFVDWPEGWPFPNSQDVEYYLQTDGTRNLGGVPVRGSTWGAIKALYDRV